MSGTFNENLGGFLFLGAVLALIAWLIRRIVTTGRVVVGEEIALGCSIDVADARVRQALESIPRANYLFVGPLMHLLVLRRIPEWVTLVFFVALPAGLVLMLVMRESITMQIDIYNRPEGAVARLTGKSEKHILGRVRAALAPTGAFSQGPDAVHPDPTGALG